MTPPAGQRADWILHQIGLLYRIEEKLRQERSGTALREAVRAIQSLAIVGHWQHKYRFLPQSAMGQAVTYALGFWPQLERFLEDGQIQIDNNLVENAIRPTAVGKKNWLFIGAAQTGGTSALLYTLIQECRGLQIYQEEYLTLTLPRLPSATNRDVHTLTPAALAPLYGHAQTPHDRAAGLESCHTCRRCDLRHLQSRQ